MTKRNPDTEARLTRRAFIQWGLATSSALGVSRAVLGEVFERTLGVETAYAATELAACRTIHLVCGDGALSWFSLLWPLNEVAAGSPTNPNWAWHRPGQSQLVQGTAKPLTRGPDTPWINLPPERQVTAMMSGTTPGGHSRNAEASVLLGNSSIYAISSLLQASNPAVVPAIALLGTPRSGLGGGTQDFGTAPGSAPPVTANNIAALAGLFNSVASRAGGLLSDPADSRTFKTYYEALVGLNRAANRSTTTAAYRTAKNAAQLLATNLGTKLAINPDDLTRYGLTGNIFPGVVNLGRALIVAVKAFKMGLTNNLLIPALGNDGDNTADPHNAFGAGSVNVVPAQLKIVFDAFMAELNATNDDVTGRSLATDTVVTIHGDFPKNPYISNDPMVGWIDNTPRSANWTWIYSAGHLKSGWFGGASNNSIDGYDANGNTTPGVYNGGDTARYANAAIAYAVAKRDAQAIAPFANGITVSGIFGNPKDV